MTDILATVIADSVCPRGKRLTTLQLRYPRFIHSELMTHRVFSRNASSSRAIPVKKLIQDIVDHPVVPLHWGKNEPGMQANEEHDATIMFPARDSLAYASNVDAWLYARDQAVKMARAFADAGYHKQIVNRLLEPFGHINVVLTATEFTNFLALRDHKDAEPHIAMLAREIRKVRDASTPKALEPGEWHLPYTDDLDPRAYSIMQRIKVSVARCASVSYKTVDGLDMTLERAVALYDKLMSADLLHASPAEHQATPDLWFEGGQGPYGEWRVGRWAAPHKHGNLSGWCQYRKTLANENIT